MSKEFPKHILWVPEPKSMAVTMETPEATKMVIVTHSTKVWLHATLAQ
jgi:hypothetical protein